MAKGDQGMQNVTNLSFITRQFPLSNFPSFTVKSLSFFSRLFIITTDRRRQPQMLSQSQFLSPHRSTLFPSPSSSPNLSISTKLSFPPSTLTFSISRQSKTMTSNSTLSNRIDAIDNGSDDSELDRFAQVGNKLADAAGEVIRKYFRKSFDILDKEDLSPVTIADQAAEASMIAILQERLPSHAIYGEENGWQCKEKSADYVWVLDPIDGTKSFITGKPVFGTLISLLHKGKPILGIVDQPILRERWIGLSGRRTRLNGEEISTRKCPKLSQAYLYTTSPHLFNAEAKEAFVRARDKVKVPLYGCDCYAYALLATGHVDLVIEFGLKPYDFLALIPVIEGAGGVITDWKGNQLHWEAATNSQATSFNVLAAGDKQLHQQALDSLDWQ